MGLESWRERVARGPMGLVARVVYKLTLGRVKYGRGSDYDAERYWTDRFKKAGFSLRGPGHEGLSEEANRNMYMEAAEHFTQFCEEQGITCDNKRVLEIGCGNGFYTNLIAQLSPTVDFTGIDITDVLFPVLKNRHPSFKFIKADVTEPWQDLGPFDVIVMIDVLQHIVTDDRFRTTMANIKRWLTPGGTFIVGPIASVGRKELFYVRWWSVRSLRQAFQGYRFSERYRFRGRYVVAITSTKNPIEDWMTG